MKQYKIEIGDKMKHLGYTGMKNTFVRRDQCLAYGQEIYGCRFQDIPGGWTVVEVVE